MDTVKQHVLAEARALMNCFTCTSEEGDSDE